jgi:23S rRNA (uracil1939-C5)-methyltransferase
MARRLEPFECEIVDLGPRGTGVGVAPDGRPVEVRGGLPGSRVAVVPTGRRKGVWTARRTAMLAPPPGYEPPPCPIFGLCGGCTLQGLALPVQRALKHARAIAEVGPGSAAVHAPRGGPRAYGYRNKVELTFGPRRYLDEAAHAAGQPIDGRFLGFHAPGRFDRIVDAERCLLVSDHLQGLLAAARRVTLTPAAPEPWDPRSHQGFWRHLVLREAAGGSLAVLVTSPPEGERTAAVERAAAALLDAGAAGVTWWVNDGVASVARGRTERTWGATSVDERIAHLTLGVSAASFLQTSTEGARVLYDTVGEALGRGGTLFDLYCGIGAIGLYVADHFDRIVGIEEVADAVADAQRNAERAGVDARFVHARVEDALDEIAGGEDVHVVVDPPRAGLHPRVAAKLAALPVASLVYVACAPSSLGRDARILEAGGFRMTDLHTVDLFPQTGHVEAVARFVR